MEIECEVDLFDEINADGRVVYHSPRPITQYGNAAVASGVPRLASCSKVADFRSILTSFWRFGRETVTNHKGTKAIMLPRDASARGLKARSRTKFPLLDSARERDSESDHFGTAGSKTKTNHYLKSKGRYLNHYRQVTQLMEKGMTVDEIAHLVSIGKRVVLECARFVGQIHPKPAKKQTLKKTKKYQKTIGGHLAP